VTSHAGELRSPRVWTTAARDHRADLFAQLRRRDEGFAGSPCAELIYECNCWGNGTNYTKLRGGCQRGWILKNLP